MDESVRTRAREFRSDERTTGATATSTNQTGRWSQAASLLSLQGSAGNRAVARLIQTKLFVGPVGDHHEQEADHVASRVGGGHAAFAVQRETPSTESATPAPADVERGIASARGGGRALPNDIRQEMEGTIGAGFSDVRVHTGPRATSLNEKLSSRAFTTGRDIFVRDGEPSMASASGRRLIAHELTHVVQQSEGTLRSPTIQRTYCKKCREPGGDGSTCDRCGNPFKQKKPAKPDFDPTDKKKRDEHKSKVKQHHQAVAKQRRLNKRDEKGPATLKDYMKQKNKLKPSSVTGGFREKHMAGRQDLGDAAQRVAKERTFGGGRREGLSTVTDMTPEDAKKEGRMALETLKMNETETTEEGGVKPKYGVNKPTHHLYKTKTTRVTETKDGRRSMSEGATVYGKPVIGIRDGQVNHLHGVEDTGVVSSPVPELQPAAPPQIPDPQPAAPPQIPAPQPAIPPQIPDPQPANPPPIPQMVRDASRQREEEKRRRRAQKQENRDRQQQQKLMNKARNRGGRRH